jgi:hypothetical protein
VVQQCPFREDLCDRVVKNVVGLPARGMSRAFPQTLNECNREWSPPDPLKAEDSLRKRQSAMTVLCLLLRDVPPRRRSSLERGVSIASAPSAAGFAGEAGRPHDGDGAGGCVVTLTAKLSLADVFRGLLVPNQMVAPTGFESHVDHLLVTTRVLSPSSLDAME